MSGLCETFGVGLMEVPVKDIIPNPHQPRKRFREKDIERTNIDGYLEIKPEETIHSITVFIHDTNSNMISHSYWSNRQNQIKETITFYY